MVVMKKINLPVEEIVGLFNKNMSPNDIGEMFGVSGITIIRFLNSNNINTHNNTPYKIRDIYNKSSEIIKLYVDDKKSIKKIANIYKCSTTVIMNILKNNNIIVRKRGWNFIGKTKNYKVENGFTKGTISLPWNKGLTKYTSKRMMSVSKKNSINQIGRIPWNKGIVSEYNNIRELIRNLQEFKNWRYSVYRRDKNTCQICGHKQDNNMSVHAHHIISLMNIIKEYNITNYEEALLCDLLWDTNNGVTLCEECHKNIHYGNNSYRYEEVGDEKGSCP